VEDLNDEENVEEEDDLLKTQLMKQSILSDQSSDSVQIRNSLIV
jgi:hypothetical protein